MIYSGEEFQPIWWLFAWLGGFSHLWFLWMLLWLMAAFIGAAKLGVKFSHPVLWWLAVPLTLLPQLLMHEPTFGPDTSDDLVPQPGRAVLLRALLRRRRDAVPAGRQAATGMGVRAVARAAGWRSPWAWLP